MDIGGGSYENEVENFLNISWVNVSGATKNFAPTSANLRRQLTPTAPRSSQGFLGARVHVEEKVNVGLGSKCPSASIEKWKIALSHESAPE